MPVVSRYRRCKYRYSLSPVTRHMTSSGLLLNPLLSSGIGLLLGSGGFPLGSPRPLQALIASIPIESTPSGASTLAFCQTAVSNHARKRGALLLPAPLSGQRVSASRVKARLRGGTEQLRLALLQREPSFGAFFCSSYFPAPPPGASLRPAAKTLWTRAVPPRSPVKIRAKTHSRACGVPYTRFLRYAQP